MRFQSIKINDIDATKGLRAVSEPWAQTMAEEALRDGGPRWPAIDVIAIEAEKFRLVDGRRRVAASLKAGFPEIEARVLSAEEFASEASLQLHEIKSNMLQSGVTALERATYLATWKALHEAATGPAKRGRKSAGELRQTSAAIQAGSFEGIFSKVAAEALDISERSVRVAVQVSTGLSAPVKARLAPTHLAQNMSELLLLSGESHERQEKILGLIFADPPVASSVLEAVAILDRVAPPRQMELWETVYARVAKLPPNQQDRFFDAMAPAIERWMMTRTTSKAS